MEAPYDCPAIGTAQPYPDSLIWKTNMARTIMIRTSRAFRNGQLPLLYKELHALTDFEMALTMNSGAEAVETASRPRANGDTRLKEFPTTKPKSLSAPNPQCSPGNRAAKRVAAKGQLCHPIQIEKLHLRLHPTVGSQALDRVLISCFEFARSRGECDGIPAAANARSYRSS